MGVFKNDSLHRAERVESVNTEREIAQKILPFFVRERRDVARCIADTWHLLKSVITSDMEKILLFYVPGCW